MEVTVPRPRIGAIACALVLTATAVAALSPDVDRALRDSKYVYVQSERKSGELGKTAEIWFLYDKGLTYVGTRPTSWRVRRIKAGRKKARIAVGKADGPAFDATGEVAHDPAIEKKLMEEFAKKYPEGWSRFADSFRDGFKSGDRVIVRYTPK
jgi:hypothetical protein